MSLTFEDVKRAVKEALAEAGGGSDIGTDPIIEQPYMREDGAVFVPELAAMKRKFQASDDKQATFFAQYIPEFVFSDEFLTNKQFELNAEQYTNISYNTNRARMTGGFLGAVDYVGPASSFTKRWPWSNPEPTKAIEDAAVLPGNNGPNVPGVGLKDVGGVFLRLFDRYKATQHVPAWKIGPPLQYF
jgi:hypothetical protein